VGLARDVMAPEFENEVAKCSNLSELRKIASSLSGIKQAVRGSLSPVKTLLCNIFSRLKLHDNYFRTYESATEDELSNFWTALIALDATLQEGGHYRKNNISQHEFVSKFIAHCCQASMYSFDVLKCGHESCTICRPIRLPKAIFDQLHHMPHPNIREDNHYLPFSEVFGSETTEQCPSLTSKKSKSKNTLPFYGCLQHVKNSNIVIQCSECEKWRLVFSKFKLKSDKRKQLMSLLDSFLYTCGSQLSDIDLPQEFKDVEIKEHCCNDIIEKLYYSAKYDPICIYCGQEESFTNEDTYPQCTLCIHRPSIKRH
jgi:hypothetical protein